MNFSVFLFAVIKFHPIISVIDPPLHFHSISTVTGALLIVQIVLAHFRDVQFECFLIAYIVVFVLTQIEYLEFR